MEYSDEYLLEYLPREPPPFDYVPVDVIEDIERWAGEEDQERAQLMARSTQWTYAMFAELRLGQFDFAGYPPYWGRYPGWDLSLTSIGLVDQALGLAGFGLTIQIDPDKGLPAIFELGRVYFSRLENSFPVYLEQTQRVDHAHPHPLYATGAGWAQCNRARQWGILTAGHKLGVRPGRPIPLADGQTGQLVRTGYPVVDAAFIATPDAPSQISPMKVRSFPAAGHKVEVQCQSGPAPRTVVKVDDNLGVVNTIRQAVLMYTDNACSPGDSGALVETPNAEAVGLYLGGLETAQVSSGMAGRVLSFEQALYALDVTAYR